MSVKSVKQPSKSGTSTSRRNKKVEVVRKAERRKVTDSSGTTREVDLLPGDIITTVTQQDGRQISSVRHKDPTKDYSVNRKTSTTRKSQTSTRSPKQKKQIKPKQEVKPQYQIANNDLGFINQYVQAYKNERWDEVKALNVALAKNPNQDLIWRGIWRGINPINTPERSAAQHEMIYTQNGMGNMNWRNIFDNNLIYATRENSLDYVSPEWRAKTIQLTTDPSYSIPTLQAEDVIKANLDRFENQYKYAKAHDQSFDYRGNQFDSTGLNVNNVYGGIGDFMDTYRLTPDQLYLILKKYYK